MRIPLLPIALCLTLAAFVVGAAAQLDIRDGTSNIKDGSSNTVRAVGVLG
jgi:hypothetical protein